jgi:hypothetical protein
VTSIRVSSLFFNSVGIWTRLAWHAGEMAIASAQVIGHRTRRIALAGSTPSVRDQREFALMGQEKGDAALEVAQAVGGRLWILNQQIAALSFKHMISTSSSFVALASSRTGAEWLNRQSSLLRNTMNGSVGAASKLSGSTAQLARRALTPVQSRVSKNLKRLNKK